MRKGGGRWTRALKTFCLNPAVVGCWDLFFFSDGILFVRPSLVRDRELDISRARFFRLSGKRVPGASHRNHKLERPITVRRGL